MTTTAGTFSYFKRNNQIHEFEELFFKLKIENIDNDSARLLFLDVNDNQISIPDGIVCMDKTNNDDKKKPLLNTESFLIFWINDYIIYYNNEKIFQMNKQKQISLKNYRKKTLMNEIIKDNNIQEDLI